MKNSVDHLLDSDLIIVAGAMKAGTTSLVDFLVRKYGKKLICGEKEPRTLIGKTFIDRLFCKWPFQSEIKNISLSNYIRIIKRNTRYGTIDGSVCYSHLFKETDVSKNIKAIIEEGYSVSIIYIKRDTKRLVESHFASISRATPGGNEIQKYLDEELAFFKKIGRFSLSDLVNSGIRRTPEDCISLSFLSDRYLHEIRSNFPDNLIEVRFEDMVNGKYPKIYLQDGPIQNKGHGLPKYVVTPYIHRIIEKIPRKMKRSQWLKSIYSKLLFQEKRYEISENHYISMKSKVDCFW